MISIYLLLDFNEITTLLMIFVVLSKPFMPYSKLMCWHLLSTTHAGCNTREPIHLWHLLGRLPLASRLALAHGEVHR